MKLIPLILLLPALAYGEPCETVTYSHSTAPRVQKVKRPSAKPVGVKRIAKRVQPNVVRLKKTVRYDCPPLSPPPGYEGIIPGVPYIGIPPVWGQPYPLPIPSGPLPIWPGSPDDFPYDHPPSGWDNPGIPGWPSSPPAPTVPPTDVPEPPTISVILFGLALIALRRYRNA